MRKMINFLPEVRLVREKKIIIKGKKEIFMQLRCEFEQDNLLNTAFSILNDQRF